MTSTTDSLPAHRTPADLALGFLTGGVVGVSLAAFVGGCATGSAPLLATGLVLPALYALLFRLLTTPRRTREAARAPRTALALIESLESFPGEASDVPVRFELTVAPDDAAAYRVEVRQDVNRAELAGLRVQRVVVVEYRPDRPRQVRIVRRPTPAWEERAAEARLDSAPGPALPPDPDTGGAAGGLVTLLGLLLGVAAVVVGAQRIEERAAAGRDSLAALVSPGGLTDWEALLVLWCAVCGLAALVRLGMSLAGVTGAQQTVRLTGRIEQVHPPLHGGSRLGGIPVVVTYHDPVSGQRVTVAEDGGRGEMITAAWVGREVGVNHPRGRAHAYRLSDRPEQPERGLGWPLFALFLAHVGLVVLAAISWAWPWALIGVGGPGALLAAAALPGTARARTDRLARLAAAESVPGRVVAVLEDVSVDQDDGQTRTTVTPVVSFTTRAGTAVTAHCTAHLPDPHRALGREVTVHYTPADPAEFTLAPSARRDAENLDLTVNVLAVVVLAAAAVAGALLL